LPARATQFRVDYLKPSGAIGFYHADWVVVQRSPSGEQCWIVETKGPVWEGTAAKDDAIRTWCARGTQGIGRRWDYRRVDQPVFRTLKPNRFQDLVAACVP
jgi:type III restriction enzyme